MTQFQPYVVAILPIESLRATEQVDPAKVRRLAASIRRHGQWLVPLPIEARTGLVMDGNHRLRAAVLLGLRRLPCVPLGYEDGRVTVHCWRSDAPFDVDRVLALATRHELLPFKTTRHGFDLPLPQSQIPIALLG